MLQQIVDMKSNMDSMNTKINNLESEFDQLKTKKTQNDILNQLHILTGGK